MARKGFGKWHLLAGGVIFTATTVAITAVVTLYWSGRIDRIFPPQPPADHNAHDGYDFPDQTGRLTAVIDEEPTHLGALETDYDVDIRGDLAEVTVQQSFENPTEATIHPTYEFPLHPEAAVHEMTMRIGEQTYRAEIKRKKEARETFERAKEAGQNAALLSQDRPNLFTQELANVQPEQTVDVTLRYTHALPRRGGTYRLALPLKVGPRFSPNGSSKLDGDGQKSGPETLEADAVSVEVRIDGGMPVRDVRSASHAIHATEMTPRDWRVELAAGETPANRHFRLRYRLSGDEVQSGVNSHWDASTSSGYFNLLLEPPMDADAATIADREMVFVIDKSGSMQGAPLEATKSFVKRGLRNLRADDRFRIILFSQNARELSPKSLQATEENVAEAVEFIDGLEAGGGTMMTHGIRKALTSPKPPEAIRLVAFLTDGQVSNEFEVIRLLRSKVGTSRLFALGVGGDQNSYLLEEMGRVGRGFAHALESGADGEIDAARIDRLIRRLKSPVLTDVVVDWGGLEVRDVTPERIPDLFAGDSVRLHGRYEANDGKTGRHTLTVRGTMGGTSVEIPVEATFAGPEGGSDGTDAGRAVKLSWARAQIADQMHAYTTPEQLRRPHRGDRAIREAVVELGLTYGLTTQWTSFVAVGEESKEALGQPVEESKPAPRHEGVGGGGKRSRIIGRLAASDDEGQAKAPKQKAVAELPKKQRFAGTAERKEEEDDRDQLLGLGMGTADNDKSDRSAEAPKGQVRPKRPTVTAGLDTEVVRRVLRAHHKSFRSCYRERLDKKPEIEGELTVRFEFPTSGDVRKVAVAKSTLKDAELERCVVQVFESLVFPERPSGGVIEVEYPLEFSPEP